jgi:hypothetical protein
MKKIALLTWFSNGNYGTATQAYALKSILSEFGECSIIPYKSEKYKYSIDDLLNSRKRHILFIRLQDKMFLKTRKVYADGEKNKSAAMRSFFCQYLGINQTSSDVKELQKIESEYDCFVCGSDQIWNPNHYNPIYFLDFVKEKKKISYAPSFGVSNLDGFPDIVSAIGEMLSKFDSISVREESGKRIVNKLINRDVQVCLDPTLMLSVEKWVQFANNSAITLPSHYIYCLFLGDYKRHVCSIDEVSKVLSIDVIHHAYNRIDYFSKYKKLSGLSPVDFVNAIKNASFVCTDSFHATVFAILFHKPFICFRRFSDKDKKSQNTRVENLLSVLSLLNRLDMECRNKASLLNIDFGKSDNILNELRKQSMDYLNRALSD